MKNAHKELVSTNHIIHNLHCLDDFSNETILYYLTRLSHHDHDNNHGYGTVQKKIEFP